MSKERVSRREFLKITSLTALGFFLSSCAPKRERDLSPEPKPTSIPPKPTETPTLTPIPTFTPTPTETPTPELLIIQGREINEEYLKQTLADIGGEVIITNGSQETTLLAFTEDYVSQAWGKEIVFETLPEKPIDSLEYLVSLGAYQGAEGVFYPGKQGEEIVFPQVGELSFARLTLKNVPSEVSQKTQEYKEWVFPKDFLLRPGTQMTLIGLLEKTPPQGVTVIDTQSSGEKLNYVLVAFTDYLRASDQGVPRHYFAIFPDNFPADPENKNTLTLKNLLEANGYQYNPQTKEIVFVDKKTGKQTKLSLNQIKGETLEENLRKEAGLVFVDKLNPKDEQLIKNPIVPYPENMPAVWEIEQRGDEQGNIFFVLKGQQVNGEFKDVMFTKYDKEKENWVWEPIPEIAKEEVLSIEGLSLRWNQEVKRWEYFDPQDNLLVGFWNQEQKKFELDPNLTVLRARWKGLYEKATEEQLAQLDKPEKPEKIPIPFDFAACEEGEIGIWYSWGKDVPTAKMLMFKGIPIGTKIYAPFGGELEWGAVVDAKGGPDRGIGVDILKNSVVFSLYNQYLEENQREFLNNKLRTNIKSGEQIGLVVSEKPWWRNCDGQFTITLHFTEDPPLKLLGDFSVLARTPQGKFLTF